MDFVLQLWGGSFYLLNKVFFAFAEGKGAVTKRRLRIAGWAIYIMGVPAWVILLASKHDWIAASIEAGGVPAMLFGLHTAYQQTDTPNRNFDVFAGLFTYASLGFGVSYSVYDYGGITSGSQFLEIGVMLGFLVGSYLLARKNPLGWLFFMLMNGSMASLMLLQHKPLLTIQQLVSLCFVVYGFTASKKVTKQRTAPGDVP